MGELEVQTGADHAAGAHDGTLHTQRHTRVPGTHGNSAGSGQSGDGEDRCHRSIVNNVIKVTQFESPDIGHKSGWQLGPGAGSQSTLSQETDLRSAVWRAGQGGQWRLQF